MVTNVSVLLIVESHVTKDSKNIIHLSGSVLNEEETRRFLSLLYITVS